MNALGKSLQRLLKAETWQRPKNIWVLLIVAIFVPILVGLAISFGNYFIEAYFRSLTISVNYQPVAVLKAEELDNYAQTNGFDVFKRNLDDDVVDNYFVVPFILRNSTRNPVEMASLKIDLGCPDAKIIDVKYIVKSPKSKLVNIHDTLPKLRWKFPTNQHFVEVSLGENSTVTENFTKNLR